MVTPVWHQGVVWCIRVPSGAFVARRNGKVFVTGNSGFPKSDGCLKPAYEPIILARKPGKKVLPLGIDECRIKADDGVPLFGNGRREAVNAYANGMGCDGRTGEISHAGRWPANVVHDGSDEVMEGFPEAGSTLKHSYPDQDSGTGGESGKYGRFGAKTVTTHADSGSAARFFAMFPEDESGWMFRRAKAIMEVWNQQHAFIVEKSSSLPSEAAAFALAHAVVAASQEGRRLNGVRGLSTNVTPSELRTLAESAIAATLSIERRFLPEQQQGKPIPSSNYVKCAVGRHSGTTTITISHWKSDGSADRVTLDITLSSEVPGVPGSPSQRFNYCAKASKEERNEGLHNLTPARGVRTNAPRGSETEKTVPRRNNHPTVKPVALMSWLVRLVCPAGGLVLDPFAGSGSTGVACRMEGRRFIGVEQEEEYADLARRRIASVNPLADSCERAAAKAPERDLFTALPDSAPIATDPEHPPEAPTPADVAPAPGEVPPKRAAKGRGKKSATVEGGEELFEKEG